MQSPAPWTEYPIKQYRLEKDLWGLIWPRISVQVDSVQISEHSKDNGRRVSASPSSAARMPCLALSLCTQELTTGTNPVRDLEIGPLNGG